MCEFMAITKALADANRVRVLLALKGRELCVCQLIELLALAPSTVSKHLSVLHQARLIESRKTERWVYCRLPGREASVTVREAIDWVVKSMRDHSAARADAKKLEQILKLNPSVICQRQGRR